MAEQRAESADANHATEIMSSPNTNINATEITSSEPAPQEMQIVKGTLNNQWLLRVAMDGDWVEATEILRRNPELRTERIGNEGMTAFHIAARCGRSEFVEEFVSILSPEELEMKDNMGNNVLHHAAVASDVSAAQAILERNPKLAGVENGQQFTPLFQAASWRHPSKSEEMLDFLSRITPYEAKTAPALIVAITSSGCHGVALRILKRRPKLALARDAKNRWSILHMLATQPSAFSSPKKTSLLCPWMNEAAKQQQRHEDAKDLVHFVCQQLSRSRETPVIMGYFLPDNFHAILHLATVHGAVELVEICLQYFPNLIWNSSGSDKRMLLHVAVEHRREEIYNLVMRLAGGNAGVYVRTRVGGDNNILHLAANLAPTPQLHSVTGPAFQTQRELQWFKAVESIVYTEERHAKNSKKFTPEELFSKMHKDLIKDAKEWTKDISSSCMVVAALVATVAFASMITVPGGNYDNGIPHLSKEKLFIVFSIANALSMISSAITLLMFLSLQTSRYTYKDFLESLPKNLLRGLLALFVAVATMMIAFGTAIGLALQTRIKWVYIPVVVVACIPTVIFTWLQLPLLFQTMFTSGPVFFGSQRNRKPRRSLNKIGYNLVPNDHLV